MHTVSSVCLGACYRPIVLFTEPQKTENILSHSWTFRLSTKTSGLQEASQQSHFLGPSTPPHPSFSSGFILRCEPRDQNFQFRKAGNECKSSKTHTKTLTSLEEKLKLGVGWRTADKQGLGLRTQSAVERCIQRNELFICLPV